MRRTPDQPSHVSMVWTDPFDDPFDGDRLTPFTPGKIWFLHTDPDFPLTFEVWQCGVRRLERSELAALSAVATTDLFVFFGFSWLFPTGDLMRALVL